MAKWVFDQSVNRFRANRGRVLKQHIQVLADRLGRDIIILDLGGRADYWANVGHDRVARIDLVNTTEEELQGTVPPGFPPNLFRSTIGDARDLANYRDKSVDLVHSNSVIEHVGGWRDMAAMANEAIRVGIAGWIQTPAWEFPIEPHFHLPFMHWFGKPVATTMLSISPLPAYRSCDLRERRWAIEQINLVSKSEFRALFPGIDVYTERVLLAKSYTARWLPVVNLLDTAATA